MNQVANSREQLAVHSEYEPLELVLVHTPGEEIDRLRPTNAKELLFEDTPYLPRIREEHGKFVEELTSRGIRVLKLQELVSEIAQSPRTLRRLLVSACRIQQQPSLAQKLLDHYPEDQLVQILFGGLTVKEFTNKTGLRLNLPETSEDPFLLSPLPNAYFTRDPATVLWDGVVSCKMHYPARIQESILVREVFREHPMFRDHYFLFGDAKEDDRPFTVEGGDVIILSHDAVAVGRSERTRSETISRLATRLFERGGVQRVYEIDIPARREYMHLDTVFTVIDHGRVVAYPGVMENIKAIRRYDALRIANQVIAAPIDESRPFNILLEEEFNGHLEVIHTADNDPRYADREQRADGTNVLAIAPSTVITYNRNPHTNKALVERGIDVIEIEGSELVRGLGGPRCMTMPLRRRSLSPGGSEGNGGNLEGSGNAAGRD